MVTDMDTARPEIAFERLKDELLATVGHELRTPLTAIHGTLQLLEAGALGDLSAEGSRLVDIAITNSRRVSRLIDRMLDVNRLKCGRLVLKKEQCDVLGMAHEAIGRVATFAQARNIDIKCDVAGGRLWGDRNRLVEVLENLLDNAVRYSPFGGLVRLLVQRDANQVMFSVQDEGMGIAAQDLETIFEEFGQLDQSNTRTPGGAGLSLCMSRYVVRQHGGRMWAESTPGCGATFLFMLPAPQEQSLLENAESFRKLVENLNDVFWMLDTTTRQVVYVSPAYELVWGRSRESLYADPQSWQAAVPAEDQAMLDEAYVDQAAGRPTQTEYRVIRSDGSVRWIRDRRYPMRNEFGDLSTLIGIAEDITETHLAEQQLKDLNADLERRVADRTARLEESAAGLRASKQQYQCLVASAPDGVMAVDAEGLVVEWNHAAEKVFGYTRSEIRGQPCSRLMCTPHRECVSDNVLGFGRIGLSAYIGAGPTVVLGIHQDGRQIPLEVSVGSWDMDGRPQLSVILRDITERLQVQEHLAQQRRHFEAVFKANPDAMAFMDENRRIQMFNPAFQRLFGFDTDVSGMSTRVIYGSDAQFEEMGHAIPLEPGQEICREPELRRNNGDLFPAEMVVSVVVAPDGHREGYLGIIRDLTARHLLENQFRQAQKMEAVGQLAGGVAHDFNNLLTVIGGYASMLQMDLNPQDPAREMVAEIGSAAEKAAALTSQLLTFSRRHVIKREMVDFNRVVENCRRILHRLIGEDIDFHVDLSAAPLVVSADRGQLEQILMNLAVNARDAMPDGGVLRLRTEAVTIHSPLAAVPADLGPGDYVRITVADTGIGMDAATQARLFEPFFTTKPVGKGTGLGLATVYGVVTQGQGGLMVRSAPGQGTTFEIWLPRVLAAAGSGQAKAEMGSMRSQGETILVVEDEAMVRRLMARALRNQGYNVLEAGDGRAGLETFLAHAASIALLVTDIVMPHLSGVSLAEQLRATHAETGVLFLSGYLDDKVGRLDLQRPDVNFLPKPLVIPAFLQRVRDILDQRAQVRCA